MSLILPYLGGVDTISLWPYQGSDVRGCLEDPAWGAPGRLFLSTLPGFPPASRQDRLSFVLGLSSSCGPNWKTEG